MTKSYPAQSLKCKISIREYYFITIGEYQEVLQHPLNKTTSKTAILSNFKPKMPKFWPKFVQQSIFVLKNVIILSNNIILQLNSKYQKVSQFHFNHKYQKLSFFEFRGGSRRLEEAGGNGPRVPYSQAIRDRGKAKRP